MSDSGCLGLQCGEELSARNLSYVHDDRPHVGPGFRALRWALAVIDFLAIDINLEPAFPNRCQGDRDLPVVPRYDLSCHTGSLPEISSGNAIRDLESGAAFRHTETPRQIRIISFRKATKHEQAIFFKNL